MAQRNFNTIQDILDALDQDPELQRALHQRLVKAIQTEDELRQELRKEILTEELLQMPVRFLRLEQAVENLLQDMTEVKQDVAELKQDVSLLKDQQTRMSGQIANLAGSDYESKAIEQSRRLVRRNLDMVKATVIHASQWESQTVEENILLPAIADGRINRQQADQLEDADSIIRCEDQGGNIVHAVAEISITVQDTDRKRAAERAEILAAVTRTSVVPFVVGQEEEPPWRRGSKRAIPRLPRVATSRGQLQDNGTDTYTAVA